MRFFSPKTLGSVKVFTFFPLSLTAVIQTEREGNVDGIVKHFKFAYIILFLRMTERLGTMNLGLCADLCLQFAFNKFFMYFFPKVFE